MQDNLLMKLDRVTKTYIMETVEALKETTLKIYEGELLVILGPSGSGKSTLLNTMGGIDTPTSGEVFFDGSNLVRAGNAGLTRFRRNEVGFAFQFYT